VEKHSKILNCNVNLEIYIGTSNLKKMLRFIFLRKTHRLNYIRTNQTPKKGKALARASVVWLIRVWGYAIWSFSMSASWSTWEKLTFFSSAASFNQEGMVSVFLTALDSVLFL